MPKNHWAKKSRNNQQSNGLKHRSLNHSSVPSAQSKAVLKVKQAKQNDQHVKAMFMDSHWTEEKEQIQMFWDSNLSKLLIKLEKQLLKLGNHYNLLNEGEWKILCQIGRWSLGGCIEQYWSGIIKGARNHSVESSSVQKAQFKKLIQQVNTKYLAKDAADDQKNAMEHEEL